MALLVVGVAVPTPGAVGGFHDFYRLGATTFFGAPNDRAVGAAMVLHAVSFVPVAIAGLILLAQDGLSLSRLHGSRARQPRGGSGVKCPFCAHLGDKVVDSRESKEGEVIRRRRECLDCGKRFTSYERIDEIPYMVVKKDGTPRALRAAEADRRAAEGVREAAGQRRRALEGVADRVEATLQERPEKEIATAEIGGLRDGGAEAARQGRLCAVRVGLPALPRHRRVHDRAEGSAEREGMTRLRLLLVVALVARAVGRASARRRAMQSGHAARARRPGARLVPI